MSNYPPGVTGLEYEIAGPDGEDEVECPECGKVACRSYYKRRYWIECDECGFSEEGYGLGDWDDTMFELAGDR